MIHEERVINLNDKPVKNGEYVLYWMQASARSEYNHALEYAIIKSNELNKPLVVFFGLDANYPEANLRHFHFLLEGLRETKSALEKRNIKMIAAISNPAEKAIELARKASLLITDRGYLRHQKLGRKNAASKSDCRVTQVESDAIVPVGEASPKEEFAARTIRPKISKQLNKYLVSLNENKPQISSHGLNINSIDLSDIAGALKKLNNIDSSVKKSKYFKGGTSEARALLRNFIETRLESYDENRNDPSLSFLSNMSPYLHFGQISPLYIALEIKNSGKKSEAIERYLEEIIIRRELSFNFCEYNDKYDSYEALPEWAIKSLESGDRDKRNHVYDIHELESAATHDHYWNAAQLEMVATGKMHNYMRMYWGKKIIEWSPDFRQAYKIMLYLNNKYELDGRDPNSYSGVAWCFGKHDRPWTKRPIFGSIRYMNDKGLARKFDMDLYIKKSADLCAEEGIKMESLTHIMEK